MNVVQEILQNALQQLEETIAKAMVRTKAEKETDLCQYLPREGGRLHHFAFGKLKKSRPLELLKLIKEHILEKVELVIIPSKPRPSLRVKRQVEMQFKRSQINRLVEVLRKAGEEELISIFAPHQTLAHVQKLMLDMVKEKKVDQELWETYIKLVEEEAFSRNSNS